MMMLSPYRPEGAATIGFGAEIFFYMEIYASRRGVPLKMPNFVGILLNFASVLASHFAPGGSLSFPSQLPLLLPLSPYPLPRYHALSR